MPTLAFSAPRRESDFPSPSQTLARIWVPGYAFVLSLSIVGYPLVAAVTQVLVGHDRSVSIAFRSLVLALAVITLVASQHVRISGPRLAFAVAVLLWIALLARYLWDATVVPLPLDLPWAEYALMIAGTVLVPALSVARLCDIRALDLAVRLMQMLGLLAAVFIAITFAVAARDFLSGYRLGIEGLNPISVGHLGVALVIVSILAPARALKPGNAFCLLADSWITRWLGGLLGLALVVAAASRGPALALIAVFVLQRVVRDVSRHGALGVLRAGAFIVATGAAFAGIAYAIVGNFSSIPIVSRVLLFSVDQAVSIRAELVLGALQQFEESPLIGSSFVELIQRFYPHNILVEILMTNGIVGFVLLMTFLTVTVVAALRLLRTPYAWLALLCTQYMVGSMTSGSLYFDAPFWMLAIALLVAEWKLRSESSTEVVSTSNSGPQRLVQKI